MLKDMKGGEEFQAKTVDTETHYRFMKWGSRLWRREWDDWKGTYEWVECHEGTWRTEWNESKGTHEWYRMY